eukprot:12788196-Ditylum_brightwellii.AAC.1
MACTGHGAPDVRPGHPTMSPATATIVARTLILPSKHTLQKKWLTRGDQTQTTPLLHPTLPFWQARS